jgi:inosine-uridine nucleoside N-ribohydrolase
MLVQNRNFHILGLTLTSGNEWIEQGQLYMAYILEVLGKIDIPIYLGPAYPLKQNLERVQKMKTWFQLDWIGAFAKSRKHISPPYGGKMPKLKSQKKGAVDFIVKTIQENPNEVSILAIGPLTNIALALQKNPQIAKKINNILIMGGAVKTKGNVTPHAEFNTWFDPEAARVVLRSAIPKKLVFALDITNQASINKTHFDQIVSKETPITKIYRQQGGNYYPGFFKNPQATSYIWDCIPAGYLIDPSIVENSEELFLDVVTDFGPQYGKMIPTTHPIKGQTKVTLMKKLNFKKFFSIYKDLLTKPVQ